MLKKISVSNLKPGMYVTNITQKGISLHEREGRIKDAKTIQALKRKGLRELFIDTDKGLDSENASPVEEVDAQLEEQISNIRKTLKPPKIQSVPFEQEWQKAQRLHKNALNLVSNALGMAKNGDQIESEPFEEMADNFIDSVVRNQNALACLSRIRDKDSYLMEHSVNVALLMSILGKQLELDRPYLHQCVTGALLHDIGKILIPDQVLHKPDKLSDEEFSIMRKHSTYSKDILQKYEQFSQVAINVAVQHHERMDGAGYPAGLKGDEISPEGRMAAVVDIYDAITADRVYHKGIAPSIALRKMLDWSDSHLDIKYVHAFIKAIGVYPVGSLVELSNHRAAIVMEENTDTLRPKVRIIYDLVSDHYVPIHNLNLMDHSTAKILRAIDPEEYGIDIHNFLSS